MKTENSPPLHTSIPSSVQSLRKLPECVKGAKRAKDRFLWKFNVWIFPKRSVRPPVTLVSVPPTFCPPEPLETKTKIMSSADLGNVRREFNSKQRLVVVYRGRDLARSLEQNSPGSRRREWSPGRGWELQALTVGGTGGAAWGGRQLPGKANSPETSGLTNGRAGDRVGQGWRAGSLSGPPPTKYNSTTTTTQLPLSPSPDTPARHLSPIFLSRSTDSLLAPASFPGILPLANSPGKTMGINILKRKRRKKKGQSKLLQQHNRRAEIVSD